MITINTIRMYRFAKKNKNKNKNKTTVATVLVSCFTIPKFAISQSEAVSTTLIPAISSH